MPLLHLDALPPHTTRGTIVRLLTTLGGIDRKLIGEILVGGRSATVEIPDNWAARLVRELDGADLDNRHIRAWTESDKSQKPRSAHAREDHFDRLTRLLELESQAEARQAQQLAGRGKTAEAERAGICLTRLVSRDEHAGLGGRTLLTLGPAQPDRPLPWTRLGVGSPVLLVEELPAHESRKSESWRGIVSQRDTATIQLALQQSPEPQSEQPTWRVMLSSDEVARQRQRSALGRVQTARAERLADLRDALVGEAEPAFDPPKPYEPLGAALNDSQLEAIRFALAARDVAIIHGPPGTGKTTTVAALIREAVRRGQTVLACAPSNLAVDNLLERLLAYGERAVRLGHPARVTPQLREHTLDLIVDAHSDVKLARKYVKEAYALRDKADRYTRAKPAPGAKQQMRREASELLADARRIEAQVVEHVLNTSTVLCATTTGLDSEILGQRTFDLAVIDEACQTTEPACWIPLLRSQRVVLAGDHCQLPPTVLSAEAAREGFGVSLLERLIAQHSKGISRLLTVQYRMHQSIMEFSSGEFYADALVADPSVREHLLADTAGVERNPLTETPIDFIDTAGAGYDEELEPDGESRLNPQEARLVAAQVALLRAAGVPANSIAVIAPYAAQVRHLRERIGEIGLEIDTVDGFQGREKEAVVISLVRSNATGEIGFLADERRMNVALTRARRKLIVIGDSATIGTHPFYARMLEWFERVGAYRTVWELEE